MHHLYLERLRREERASLVASLGPAVLHLAVLSASVRSGVRLAVRHVTKQGWQVRAMSTDRTTEPYGRTIAHHMTLGETVAYLDKFTGDRWK